MSSKPIQKAPTSEEFKYVTFVEQCWHKHKEVPTPKQISNALSWSLDKVIEIQKHNTVKRMLRNRGIESENANRDNLTEEQIAAVNTYLNVVDQRPIKQKLIALGIEPVRFYGWMKGANFKRYMQERAEELFEDGMPFAHRELIGKVIQGDLRAIKFFYEVSGRHLGGQTVEQQNMVILIQRLLEAVQRIIKDPELIAQIATEFKVISQGESSTSQLSAHSPAPAQQSKNVIIPAQIENLGDSI
jgi:hypothetical protein